METKIEELKNPEVVHAPDCTCHEHKEEKLNPQIAEAVEKVMSIVKQDANGKATVDHLHPKAQKKWAQKALKVLVSEDLLELAKKILAGGSKFRYKPMSKDELKQRRKRQREARKTNRR